MGKAIILQFSTESDPESAAIRAYGHGWCSHVDSVMEDGRLLGARQDGGVLIRQSGYAPFSCVQRVILPAPDDVVDAYYAFLRDQVGKPYDTLAIAAFAVDRDWRLPDHWFCSELVGRGLEVSRYFPFELATPANKLTPPDLLLVCSTRVEVPLAA